MISWWASAAPLCRETTIEDFTVTRLLAVDWGSSSLRGALIEPDGRVLEERYFARGILTVPGGEFPLVFENCFGDWMNAGTLCLISGMAGSKQGWREAPYCACPAGFDDIAGHLQWLEPGRIAIVPGLSVARDGVPDVMRGEETQVFGALALLGLSDARLVLPGTHSKWVSVTQGHVTDFATWMSGEFYALLRQHSMLARTLAEGETVHDADAFSQGFGHALRGQGLLNTAFSARTLSLFDRMSALALPSYLSGLVIGEELKAQALKPGDTVVLVGAQTLTARYQQALEHLGVSVDRVGAQATWRGLRAIADTLTRT